MVDFAVFDLAAFDLAVFAGELLADLDADLAGLVAGLAAGLTGGVITRLGKRGEHDQHPAGCAGHRLRARA